MSESWRLEAAENETGSDSLSVRISLKGFRVGANKVLREGACAGEAQGMASPFGFAEEDGDMVGHVSTNIANLPFAQG